MRIVVFSGTTEGRDFSRAAAALGIAVTVSVATDLGAEEQGQAPGITVHSGRLLPGAMAELLQGAALCVDATHPYAVEATKNIRAAANAAGVEYHRLLRAASTLPAGSVVLGSAAQAAQYLAATQGNVLLTTGAKELAAFAGLDAARLYPRVLPTVAGITACEGAGIPHRNIIAMQGPFTLELNLALMQQFHIRYLVTKDGGSAGGFAEKAQAAAQSGLRWLYCAARRNAAKPPKKFCNDAGSCYEDYIGWHGQRAARQFDCPGLAGPANGRADSGGKAAAAKPAGWLYPQPQANLPAG